MKKVFLFLSFILVFGAVSSSAQQMEKGNSIINIGAGFVPGIGGNVSYDYGLVDTWGPGLFTVGGFVGVNTWKYNNAYNISSYRENVWAIAPRATYRYSFFPNFEAYVSAMLGLGIRSYSRYYDNDLFVFVGGTAGARYSFSPNFSVFAEVGYNTAYLNLGVSIKL